MLPDLRQLALGDDAERVQALAHPPESSSHPDVCVLRDGVEEVRYRVHIPAQLRGPVSTFHVLVRALAPCAKLSAFATPVEGTNANCFIQDGLADDTVLVQESHGIVGRLVGQASLVVDLQHVPELRLVRDLLDRCKRIQDGLHGRLVVSHEVCDGHELALQRRFHWREGTFIPPEQEEVRLGVTRGRLLVFFGHDRPPCLCGDPDSRQNRGWETLALFYRAFS